MKISQSICLLIIVLALFPTDLYSQDTIQYRKLYLHTDREQYFLGDTIWFKAYYLDGQRNTFVSGLITMYGDLIDETGKSVLDQVIAIDNGTAHGAIELPSSLEPGNYVIRAFTDFQRSLGEDAFFHKKIRIAKLESFVESSGEFPPQSLPEIDLAFLPEGGMLLEGQKNTVGIKAIDSLGNGAQIQGEILDSKGKSEVTFTTSYKGMASIRFIPQKEKTYTVRLEAYPDFRYTFDDIVDEGIKIEFARESANELFFRAVTNAEAFIGRTYYFAISHHGEVIFHRKFVPRKSTFPIIVIKDALPAGINRMVLLDEQLLPVSERLYFSTNYQSNEIKIKADKQSYKTRSRISLRLSDGPGMDNESWSNLSMVVVDEFADSKDGPSVNILSWLLIDSELKGFIESPCDYFSSDRGMSSASKLDLLMMTHGWSRYIWSKPEKYLASESKEKEGFCLSGNVKKVLGNKPVIDGTVELKVYRKDFMYTDEVGLDEEGKFVFTDVNFMDTASVFIQARDKKDRRAFKVSLDPLFNNFPLTSAIYLPKEESIVPKQAALFQKQYDNLQALKEYTLKTGSFYIEEVSIVDHKREKDDGHFRIYAKPSSSLQITERDLTYPNIIAYMQGRFAGVRVSKDYGISIRGNSSFSASPPLLMLDGFPVDKEVFLSIPMNDIDRVEVLKNPSETAIFGTRGGSGVVSVFTKNGGAPDYSQKYIPGIIAKKLLGYSSSREFYAPKYTKENISSERPDHRIVQYWNPDIFTEAGKASVTFFSSDDLSRYRVYVEGISREGRICLGTATFEVNQKNEQVRQ